MIVMAKNAGRPRKSMSSKRIKSSDGLPVVDHEKIPSKRRNTADVALQNKVKLIEYLANPNNPPLCRTDLAIHVLGYTCLTSMYYHMTPAEFRDIEIEALEMRRSAYIDKLAKVDEALFLKAYEGDVAAIKLVYQRFEGWTEKKDFNIQQGITINIVRFGDIGTNGRKESDSKSS